MEPVRCTVPLAVTCTPPAPTCRVGEVGRVDERATVGRHLDDKVRTRLPELRLQCILLGEIHCRRPSGEVDVARAVQPDRVGPHRCHCRPGTSRRRAGGRRIQSRDKGVRAPRRWWAAAHRPWEVQGRHGRDVRIAARIDRDRHGEGLSRCRRTSHTPATRRARPCPPAANPLGLHGGLEHAGRGGTWRSRLEECTMPVTYAAPARSTASAMVSKESVGNWNHVEKARVVGGNGLDDRTIAVRGWKGAGPVRSTQAVTYMLPTSSTAMPPGTMRPKPPIDVEKRIEPVGPSLVT